METQVFIDLQFIFDITHAPKASNPRMQQLNIVT